MVTVNTSWWNVAIVVAEVAITILTWGSGSSASSAATAATQALNAGKEVVKVEGQKKFIDGVIAKTLDLTTKQGMQNLFKLNATKPSTDILQYLTGQSGARLFASGKVWRPIWT